jgi:catechol 2,3-dioxygenase-like lactoylglutathione lyase family enzyme
MAQGIKHIEIAVSDLQKSLIFYEGLFKILGWKKGTKNDFEIDHCDIYLKKWDFPAGNTLGVRHVCLWGTDRAMVDKVGEYVKSTGVKMIRGPLVVPEYSPNYYTVDFFDPDGCMLEVAHTPN